MTKYESMLRGGAPGSEARGMVIGSLMSLALALIGFVVAVAVGRELGFLVWVLWFPTRELIWAVPAVAIATKQNLVALRNGLLIALVMTALGGLVLGPLWGSVAATIISVVVKGIDLARAERGERKAVPRRRPPPPSIPRDPAVKAGASDR